jgi:hypothetical protein
MFKASIRRAKGYISERSEMNNGKREGIVIEAAPLQTSLTQQTVATGRLPPLSRTVLPMPMPIPRLVRTAAKP